MHVGYAVLRLRHPEEEPVWEVVGVTTSWMKAVAWAARIGPGLGSVHELEAGPVEAVPGPDAKPEVAGGTLRITRHRVYP